MERFIQQIKDRTECSMTIFLVERRRRIVIGSMLELVEIIFVVSACRNGQETVYDILG
jgi:hypothetical protein